MKNIRHDLRLNLTKKGEQNQCSKNRRGGGQLLAQNNVVLNENAQQNLSKKINTATIFPKNIDTHSFKINFQLFAQEKTKSKKFTITLISIILACVLVVAFLPVVFIYNWQNNLNNPVQAAEAYNYVSRTAKSQDYYTGYCKIYVYYDNTFISYCSISSIDTSIHSSYVYFYWTPSINFNLVSGQFWNSGIYSFKFAWNNSSYVADGSESNARNQAYSNANSSSATVVEFMRNGNTLKSTTRLESPYCNTYNGDTYCAGVLIVSQSNISTAVAVNLDYATFVSSDKTYQTVESTSDEININLTSSNHYYIDNIIINDENIEISASNQNNYIEKTGYKYKCYYNQNNVYLTITNISIGIVVYVKDNICTNYTITASVKNGETTKVTLDKTTETYYTDIVTQHTFTYTASTNYNINSITINNKSVPISETTPSSFSNGTGCQYKCYRNANKVIVTVTNLTQNVDIVGTIETLWTFSSNKPTIIIQEDETTPTFSNYFSSSHNNSALVVAEFSRNQNISICLDGTWIKLYGANSMGTTACNNGNMNYAYNRYNNYVYIELTNMPNGAHSIVLDHYVGSGASIVTSLSGGSAEVGIMQLQDNYQQVVVRPNDSNYWVNSIVIDNIEIPITYYKAEIYGAGGANTITYTTKDSTNTFVLNVEGIYEIMNVQFNLVNTKPEYKIPPTGGSASVSGAVVTAGVGGEARIVGNDISSGNDFDTVTFIALAYSGYNFAGWVYADDESEVIATDSSLIMTKTQVDGKIIKAIFTPKVSSKNNNSDLNNTNDII